jgi:hypothetical protein
MLITMKKYIIFIIFSLIKITGYAQVEQYSDNKVSQKLTKEQKAEQKRVERVALAELVDQMISTQRFVLEADYLSNQTGRRVVVSSNLNFIIVDSSKITIQTASPFGYGGPNAMGGITTEGTISSFEVEKKGKTKSSYAIKMFIMTPIGQYDIFLNVSPDSRANATISGSNFGKLNYHGRIVPRKKSKLFKGQSF